MIRGEDRRHKLSRLRVNVSGLIRSLIDDHLSLYTITLSVSEETADPPYRQIISNTGNTDEDVEPYLKAALKEMLRAKIESMEALHRSIR